MQQEEQAINGEHGLLPDERQRNLSLKWPHNPWSFMGPSKNASNSIPQNSQVIVYEESYQDSLPVSRLK